MVWPVSLIADRSPDVALPNLLHAVLYGSCMYLHVPAKEHVAFDVQVKGSRLYAEHVAQYTDPLVQRMASSPYCKAALDHIKPAHQAGAPAQGVTQAQPVDEAAADATTTTPALR